MWHRSAGKLASQCWRILRRRKSKCCQVSISPAGAPTFSAQFQSSNGMEMPIPAILARWSGSREPGQLAIPLLRAKSIKHPDRDRDKSCEGFALRAQKIHQNQISAAPTDFQPIEKAPCGSRDMGMEGCPTLPRCGSPRSRSPSSSNERMITETVCGERPELRAISDFGRLWWRRTSESTSRSL